MKDELRREEEQIGSSIPAGAAGKGSGVPKPPRRRLKLPPPGLSPQDIAALGRWARLLQAAMPPAHPPSAAADSGQSGTLDQPALSASDAEVLAKAILDQTYRRVPLGADAKKSRKAEQCPYTGLNRNQLYQLFKLRENGRRIIKRVTLSKEGKSRGVQLYNVGSLCGYLARLAEEQEQAETAKT